MISGRLLVVLALLLAEFVSAGTPLPGREHDDRASRRLTEETEGLSAVQATLMATLAEKRKRDSHGPVVKKRGYMNLITELSRVELARTARAAAVAQAAAEVAALAEAESEAGDDGSP